MLAAAHIPPRVAFLLSGPPCSQYAANSGSKHLVPDTEEIPPGGEIPRHKHLEQDEILLIQTGTAHVTLNDKEYDVHANSEPVLTKVTLSLRRSHRQQTNSVRTYVRVPGIKRRLAFYTHFR
jgi:hypothetical protein